MFDYSSLESSAENCHSFMLRCREHGAPVVIMADDADRSDSLQVIERGPAAQVRKPPHLAELKNAILAAVENSRLRKQLEAAERPWATPLDRLVGSSAAIRRVFEMIRRVADLDVNVVIRGESGTGDGLSGMRNQPRFKLWPLVSSVGSTFRAHGSLIKGGMRLADPRPA